MSCLKVITQTMFKINRIHPWWHVCGNWLVSPTPFMDGIFEFLADPKQPPPPWLQLLSAISPRPAEEEVPGRPGSWDSVDFQAEVDTSLCCCDKACRRQKEQKRMGCQLSSHMFEMIQMWSNCSFKSSNQKTYKKLIFFTSSLALNLWLFAFEHLCFVMFHAWSKRSLASSMREALSTKSFSSPWWIHGSIFIDSLDTRGFFQYKNELQICGAGFL